MTWSVGAVNAVTITVPVSLTASSAAGQYNITATWTLPAENLALKARIAALEQPVATLQKQK